MNWLTTINYLHGLCFLFLLCAHNLYHEFLKRCDYCSGLPKPVAFPPASAEDPPFIVQVHGGKWSHKTKKSASFFVSITHYLATYYHLGCPWLRWCSGWAEHHSQRTIYLSQSLLPEKSRLMMLIHSLDGPLTFSWQEMEHFTVAATLRLLPSQTVVRFAK